MTNKQTNKQTNEHCQSKYFRNEDSSTSLTVLLNDLSDLQSACLLADNSRHFSSSVCVTVTQLRAGNGISGKKK